MSGPQIAVAITGTATSLDTAIAHSEKQVEGVVSASKKTPAYDITIIQRPPNRFGRPFGGTFGGKD